MAETGFPYLVEESLGKQWYFSLSGHKIHYACRDNGVWTKPSTIDNQSVKLFRAAIDKRDKVYLLAYALSKQLIYYEWDGEQWYQRMLYRITSRFESISYLDVLSAADRIHLLYYIENSLKRAQESFVHSYLENGRWKSEILMNFLTDQIVQPQLSCSDDKGNLYCIYTKTLRNQSQCYIIRFDSKDVIWSKPAVLFQKPVKCSSFSGFVDSDGILHLIWLEETGKSCSLYYKNIDTEDLNSSSVEVCIHEGSSTVQHPSIASVNGLLCCWIENGEAMACHADPKGNRWSPPRKVTDKPAYPYIYVHKTLDGRSHTILELGDGFPESEDSSPGFEWSVRKLTTEGRELSENQQKENNADLFPHYDSQNIHHKEASVLQDLRELSKKVDGAIARMDEFYTALYQLQDYIRQKDKSFFQMDAQIRKLSFELEQLRSGRFGGRQRGSGYIPVRPVEEVQIRNTEGQDAGRMADASITSDEDNSREANPNIGSVSEADNEINKDTASSDLTDGNDNTRTGGLLKNMDHGTGEIRLGNVSILINPEEESDNM